MSRRWDSWLRTQRGLNESLAAEKLQKNTPEKGDVLALGAGNLKHLWGVGHDTSGNPHSSSGWAQCSATVPWWMKESRFR